MNNVFINSRGDLLEIINMEYDEELSVFDAEDYLNGNVYGYALVDKRGNPIACGKDIYDNKNGEIIMNMVPSKTEADDFRPFNLNY